MKNWIKEYGPFTVYQRRETDQTIDISLTCMENWPCGWEWGYRDEYRGKEAPFIHLRIGKLMVLYLEGEIRKEKVKRRWKRSFGGEIWIMGFWVMW